MLGVYKLFFKNQIMKMTKLGVEYVVAYPNLFIQYE
jgi:hypothetical protein